MELRKKTGVNRSLLGTADTGRYILQPFINETG